MATDVLLLERIERHQSPPAEGGERRIVVRLRLLRHDKDRVLVVGVIASVVAREENPKYSERKREGASDR